MTSLRPDTTLPTPHTSVSHHNEHATHRTIAFPRAIVFCLSVALLTALPGCAKSPLAAYETTAVAYVALVEGMIAAKETGAITHDTLKTFDTVATPVGEAIKTWGLSIAEEYGRPKEQRNYARVEHLAKIALASWNHLKLKWPNP